MTSVYLLKLKEGWNDSQFSVGLSHMGRFYSDDILEEERRSVPSDLWDLTDLVDECIKSDWSVDLGEEITKYLEQ